MKASDGIEIDRMRAFKLEHSHPALMETATGFLIPSNGRTLVLDLIQDTAP